MKAESLEILAALAVLVLGSTMANATVGIDLVTVGNAGNAADTTGYGAVSYDFAIGKCEVTIGQYTEFLNAVDPNGTNPNGIYNLTMETDTAAAGTSYSAGAAAGSKYAVMTNAGQDMTNRPITIVSWFDAARFSNWMTNGQGSGSTETGAYTLNGATSGIFTKNAGAIYWIPSEDEWYKAAYYDTSLNGGSGGYWQYPTQSNTAPGNTIGSGANQANYYISDYSTGTEPYLTNVGAYSASSSHYGTFDQGGNVFEWNDAVISGSDRGLRGGDWYDYDLLQSSSRSSNLPDYETSNLGFRLASVPEPSTAGLVLLAGAGRMVWKRRKVTL